MLVTIELIEVHQYQEVTIAIFLAVTEIFYLQNSCNHEDSVLERAMSSVTMKARFWKIHVTMTAQFWKIHVTMKAQLFGF